MPLLKYISNDSTDSKEIPLLTPFFWATKPASWFTHIENLFSLAQITDDETKYYHVLVRLDVKYLVDIVRNPPKENKYITIKTVLIKRLSDSARTRAKKLLKHEEMGDRTPTQFWSDLKKLADTDDEIITEIWLSRLPKKVQEILIETSITSGDKLAKIADKMYDVSTKKFLIVDNSVAEVYSEIDALSAMIEELRLSIDAIESRNSRSRSKPRHSRRSRSKSRTNKRKNSHTRDANEDARELCWYHLNFAEKAIKCTSPCYWYLIN